MLSTEKKTKILVRSYKSQIKRFKRDGRVGDQALDSGSNLPTNSELRKIVAKLPSEYGYSIEFNPTNMFFPVLYVKLGGPKVYKPLVKTNVGRLLKQQNYKKCTNAS